MKFIISRASTREEEKPCDGAFKHPYKLWGKNIENWTIEINSLEELLKLCQDEGDIILTVDKNSTPAPEITIYDTDIE